VGISNNMKPEKFNILDLIPQRPPMVMVGNHVFYDDRKTITTFFIETDNIFCKDGVFTEPGLIENIAQTCASRIGYFNKINQKEILIGFIGAIKNLKIHFLPPAQTELTTEIFIETEILGFTLIHGKVMSDGKTCAECEMRILIKQEM
jgi:predicted hotdog family 3-hydroxylacyl-ACP dehydratase